MEEEKTDGNGEEEGKEEETPASDAPAAAA